MNPSSQLVCSRSVHVAVPFIEGLFSEQSSKWYIRWQKYLYRLNCRFWFFMFCYFILMCSIISLQGYTEGQFLHLQNKT